MRRKITEVEAMADDLPELTSHQLDFVRGVVSGLTASDAYRKAYDCSQMLPNTIWCEASKLTRHPKVVQWIAAARHANMGAIRRSKEQHIARLEELQQLAKETGNVGAAVQAEQLIGKVEGHYVERVDVQHTDAVSTLRQIAQISPSIAAELAKEQGLDWETEH